MRAYVARAARGEIAEARSAADSAWALGKHDMDCAALRVTAAISGSQTGFYRQSTFTGNGHKYTPREFVVTVLKAEFRMTEDQAHKVMITAHRRGVCVVAVFTKDVAETKATRATDAGRAKGYPLLFTTEPEE